MNAYMITCIHTMNTYMHTYDLMYKNEFDEATSHFVI
jgi:hypothetical protein